MPKLRGKRAPSHSGSWYELRESILVSDIRRWLENAAIDHDGDHNKVATGNSPTPWPSTAVRAVIAPHAGYVYCGHVMAHAYRHIQPSKVKRVFLLGPSHHFYSRECHLSPYQHYSTPLGDVRVDAEIYDQLGATGKFPTMTPSQDEAEHSLELHMPYLMHMMSEQNIDFTLVPIVVGALTPEAESSYGKLLAPYLSDPSNFFILSSDFCHWGTRFNYTFYNNSHGEIYESIRNLDHEAMEIIESANPVAFTAYLRKTGNTICGRHPIGVFLHANSHSKVKHGIKFTRYDQSHQCRSMRDSSVSYASAVVWLKNGTEEDAGDYS